MEDFQQAFRRKNSEVGARISIVRNDLGLTQAAFAEGLDITRDMLAQYETSRIWIPCDFVLRLSFQYLISERWLATSEGRRRPCVDLILEPVCQNIANYRPFVEIFNVLLPHYERLTSLGYDQLLKRLLANSENCPARTQRLLDFMLAFWNYGIKPSVMEELTSLLIKKGIEYLDYQKLKFDFDKGMTHAGVYRGIPRTGRPRKRKKA